MNFKVLLIVLFSAQLSQAEWVAFDGGVIRRAFSDSTKSPPEFCVRNGLIFGEVKCVPETQAKALGYDLRKVFGLSTTPDVNAAMIAAQNDVDKANANVLQKQKAHDKLRRDIAKVEQDLGSSFLSAKQVDEFRARLSTLNAEAATSAVQLAQAREGLSQATMAAQSSAFPAGNDALLRFEIQKRGISAKLNEFENNINNFERSLKITETEFNNTVLESYITAKFAKLGQSLCEAQSMCKDKTTDLKDFLVKKIASEELRKSLNFIPTPAAAPAAK